MGIMKIYGPYSYKDRSGKTRQLINIVEDGIKRSQSYPRYLLEKHLGRALLPDEDADHVDGDTENNNLSNLRVLSAKVNRGRGHVDPEWFHFVCPVCAEPSVRLARTVRSNRKLGKEGPFCSKRCARKWQDISGRTPGKTGKLVNDEYVITDLVTCPMGHIKDGWKLASNGRRYQHCKTCSRERAASRRTLN